MLLKDLQYRASLTENVDPLDIPPHIIEALAGDVTEAMSSIKGMDLKTAAVHAVITADLAGLDDDEQIGKVAVMILKHLGHV
jgi:hypothetical protein